VASVLGLEPDAELREVAETGGDEVSVRGYVSLPMIQRANSRHLYFFVNRRAIRDKTLLQALLKAYEGTLPRGRYPAAVLFLTVAPGAVDVNVHPAKEEVRFADGGRIFALLRQAVAETLSGYPVSASSRDFFAPAGRLPARAEEASLFSGEVAAEESLPDNFLAHESLPPTFYETTKTDALSGETSSLSPSSANLFKASPDRSEQKSRPDPYRPASPYGKGRVTETRAADFSRFPVSPPGATERLPAMAVAGGFFSAMTVVGSLWNAYLVLQYQDKCYLLDQHAAHERVIFEDLKKKRLGHSAAQRLLLPVQVECTPAEEVQAEECRELLNALGFEFDSIGPRTLLLQTVPLLVDGLALDLVFLETLADIASGGRGRESAAVDAMLARLACRMAVKASQVLTPAEMRRLLERLDNTPLAHTCPHGRPFYFSLERSEIEKRFQRF
ncbi:MAG: hypothetical protein JXR80_06130, partial [Deltaproteobacteria bacterium]|nr:hypothetical protein [Deltaproteobacteria bacterium]